jgi:hypothetical protein
MKIKTAKNFKDLEKQIRKHVQEAVTDTLQLEVFNVVKEVVLDRIQTDVYDVYNPQSYIRRSDGNTSGGQGLGDSNNIVFELEGRATNTTGKTLVVWNIAKFNPRNRRSESFSTAKRKENILQTLIIDGWSRADADSPVWQQPRPFIENANKALSKGGTHRKSLEEAFDIGLERHGITKKK